MFNDVTPEILAAIVIGFLFIHTALVIVSKWVNPLFVIVMGYIALTPIAVSEFGFANLAKLGRVYFTVLLLITAVFFKKGWRLKPTTVAYMCFVCLYVLGALWSDQVIGAFMYKGLYFTLALAGAAMAVGVDGPWDYRKGMRLMTISAIGFAGIMLAELVRNPAAISSVGRFQPWDINPNRVAQIAAPLLIMCGYVALNDHNKRWKIVAWSTMAILSIIIIYTGSRAGLFMCFIGVSVAAVPLVKRPIALIVSGLLISAIVFVVMAVVDSGEATERLFTFNLIESREGKLQDAFELIGESPVFGKGWVYEMVGATDKGSTMNLHNMYMQILSEIGFFGGLVFVVVMLVAFTRGLLLLKLLRESRGYCTDIAHHCVGMTLAVLGQGVSESSTMMGSTVNGLMLTFGFGMMEQTIFFIKRELDNEQTEGWHAWDEGGDDLWDDEGGAYPDPDGGYSDHSGGHEYDNEHTDGDEHDHELAYH